jgi:CheY-like chemotaxis protein
MTVDEVVKLLDAATRLLGVLLWPILVAVVFFRFAPAFKLFFEQLGEFSLKGAGFEASAKRKQAEAAAALGAANASRPGQDLTPDAQALQARTAAEVVSEVTPRMIRRAGRATVLWVDDRPENNVYERRSLEALGVTFVLAKSTDEALKMIARQKFDVIISDMGRPPDAQAGYTLLDKLRQMGDPTPYLIYAGSRDPHHRVEARRRGALDCTNRPDELFEYVLFALGQRPV